jgi:propionate CoA-transferase
MRNVISADEAIEYVPDGATVLINPLATEEVYPAFGRAFEATGSPKDLTVVWAAGIGPFSDERRGMNHFAFPGMVKRIVAGHIGLNDRIVRMIAEDECEAYNLPQGCMTQLYREIAAKRPGLVTPIGLGTFVDPRIEGGKLNARTAECEDLVEVVELDGEEYLFYKSFHVDVGIIRGTAADPTGNITCDDEAITMENLEVAMAARNCGGVVIAQVAELRDTPANPHAVLVPDILVDHVVVGEKGKSHPHTLFAAYDPSYCGKENASPDGDAGLSRLPLNIEKVISRRVAAALRPGATVNLGVGIPMGVASVAAEEGILDSITLTTEVGVLGGLPEGGKNFGPARNPRAIFSQAVMFDFYDGGGLDLTCVGMAQVDEQGNVNVSKLGSRVIGCGGFINITQSSSNCVFAGEFTAGGMDAEVEGGRLVIRREGRVRKFVKSVQQVTFSGRVSRKKQQSVLFVTERCVFRLTPDGLLLAEIAPGVDLEKDILANMEFRPIIPDELPQMNPSFFLEAPIGLAETRDFSR